MGLSKEDVQEIIQILDDLKATELHLRTRHYTLTLRRDGERAGEVGGDWVHAAEPRTGATGEPPAEPAADGPAVESADVEPAAESAADGPAVGDDTFAVRAPLAGTFYRAPKPGAPPYVEVGSPVQEETVVGIVETMKLMNSIHAGVCGRVAEICANNAELAEQGAVLLRIAPSEPES